MLRRYQQFLFAVLASLCITALLLIVARCPAGHPVILPPAPTAQLLRVSLTGAVAAPGVCRLPPGSIAQDVLNAAGGASPQADRSRINLAQPMVDGDQLNVPARAPTAGPAPAAAARPEALTPQPAATRPKTNLNTATAAELDILPGIGPIMAQRVVDYRAQHGPFANPKDLMEISGIGEATFNRIKRAVVVGL